MLLLGKVSDYYAAKTTGSKGKIVPLFKTLDEPSVELVGNLIDLKCGHSERPTDQESIMFTVHLEAAGFIQEESKVFLRDRHHNDSLSLDQSEKDLTELIGSDSMD